MAVFLFTSFTLTIQPYNLINQTSIFKEGPYPIHHTLSYNTTPPYNLINRSPTYKDSPYSIASPPHWPCRHCWLPLPSNICQDSPNSLPPSNLICLCRFRDSHFKCNMLWDHLTVTMGICILARRHLYIHTSHKILFLKCVFNTLRSEQNDQDFADDIFKCISFNENSCSLIPILHGICKITVSISHCIAQIKSTSTGI